MRDTGDHPSQAEGEDQEHPATGEALPQSGHPSQAEGEDPADQEPAEGEAPADQDSS